jgi:hypothetical protein
VGKLFGGIEVDEDMKIKKFLHSMFGSKFWCKELASAAFSFEIVILWLGNLRCTDFCRQHLLGIPKGSLPSVLSSASSILYKMNEEGFFQPSTYPDLYSTSGQ